MCAKSRSGTPSLHVKNASSPTRYVHANHLTKLLCADAGGLLREDLPQDRIFSLSSNSVSCFRIGALNFTCTRTCNYMHCRTERLQPTGRLLNSQPISTVM